MNSAKEKKSLYLLLKHQFCKEDFFCELAGIPNYVNDCLIILRILFLQIKKVVIIVSTYALITTNSDEIK